MSSRRTCTIVLGALAVIFAVTHVIALFTEGANWDELALLYRVDETLRTGVLHGGGRPGLAVILILPFIDGCRHVIDVLRETRLLWGMISLGLVAGVFALLRRATRRTTTSWHAAALGAACFALAPLFLRWSLQVRTDQPAVTAAIWGGVLLLASQNRRWLAFPSGALAAIGYLSSQKALYVIALSITIAAGECYITRTFVWRRELRRAVTAALGGAAVLLAFNLVIPCFFTPSRTDLFHEGVSLFHWYRDTLGFRVYRNSLPVLIPQLALLVLVFAAALRAFRHGTAERRSLVVALTIVLLGLFVGWVHAAAFPYFWITLGLFPACAIGIGYAGIRELLPRAHVAVAGTCWLLLVVIAARYRAETLTDTQWIQRKTYEYAEELPATLRGFNTDGGLVCREDPDPLPAFLGISIRGYFRGSKGRAAARAFIEEHRRRPVAFIVRTDRVKFPQQIEDFWNSHYVPYAYSIWLAGRTITGPRGASIDVEILVAGSYRWQSWVGAHIDIDGNDLAPAGTIELSAGRHVAHVTSAFADGNLALVISQAPHLEPTPFYDSVPMHELSGVRRHWW